MFDATIRSLVLMKAFLGLLLVDIALRTVGYRWIRQRLARRRVSPSQAIRSEGGPHAIVALVERASRQYPREPTCLQRAIVLTWLLRDRRIPADLVIGCRHTPFYAHAWVEVDGEIVADRPTVSAQFPEFERV